ncbi:hypothetical protein Tsubulata_037964 [Turnera subulata]|uniref:Uncharacterized protein n=1 Tax=Turnera subulata TaxID=218843 RepID=A0A9Q0G497_9ROSI|nr:hypothetical protein Tsubulata_037964 [Turnera subulata]
MGQHDAKASGVVIDNRNIFPSEENVHLVKTILDASHSDGNSGLKSQKQSSVSDHEANSCETSKLADMERKCLNHDCLSSTDSAKENTDESRLSSAVASTSRNSELKTDNCAERAPNAMPHFNKPTCSTNVKDSDVSTCSPQGNDSLQNFTTNSDVSSEGREPIGKESKSFIHERMSSVMQTAYHNKRLKTEYSFNSASITLPASSDDTCLETLQDVKPCQHNTFCSKNISRYSDFKGSLEEPAFKSSRKTLGMPIGMKDFPCVGGFSPQNLSETAEDNNLVNVGDDIWKMDLPKKENEDVSELEAFYDPDDALEVARRVAQEVKQEVGMYKESSESCSLVQERSDETGNLGPDDSAASAKDCFAENGNKNLFENEQDKHDSVCCTNGEADPELSMGNQDLCLDVKELSHDTGSIKKDPTNDNMNGRVSSPLTTKPEVITNNNQFTSVLKFNLNENILTDEVDSYKQSVAGLPPSHADVLSKPIPVVAKFGIPLCLPKPHLQLDGGAASWMGFSSNSAFRPTSFPESFNTTKSSPARGNDNGSKALQTIGFDLNIAAEGCDFDGEFLPQVCGQEKSKFPKFSMETSSKGKERFNIDLNCVHGSDDLCHQPPLPTSSSRHCDRDFDLNDNPTPADPFGDSEQPGQGTLMLGDRQFDHHAVKYLGNARNSDSKGEGSLYWTDSSYMRSFSHGHARPVIVTTPNILPPVEQMQNLASLQHRSTYAAVNPTTPLPSRAFSYGGNAFFIDPNNRMSSNGYPPVVFPYLTDPRAAPVFPQMPGSGSLPAFSRTPHHMPAPGGPNNGEMAMTRPGSNLDGRVTSSDYAFQGENGRQWFIPVNIATEDQIRSFHQPSLPATPMKRKEPEGMPDSYQLGFRQMAMWP